MGYAAGGFDFPTSTGGFSVTGLGFRPKLLVMFGSNQSTVDTLLTGLTRPGLFLSLNSLDHITSAVSSFCLSFATNSNSGSPAVGYTRFAGPVRMQNTTNSAGIDYRADTLTFDGDGFSLNVTHAAPGVRPIHWWATDAPSASILGTDLSGPVAGAGFEIRSFLALSSPQSGSLVEGNTDADSWLHFGTTHYPSNAVILTDHIGRVCHTGLWLGGLGGRQGYTRQQTNSGSSGERVCLYIGSGAAGTLTEGYTLAGPQTLHGNDPEFAIIFAAGITNQQHIAFLKADGTAGDLTSPSTVGNSISVSTPSWFDEFELVMFTTVNGANVSGPFDPDQLRYGLGVLHEDYQGCVAVGDDGSFYQSRDKMAATCTAAGAQAAVGTILGPTFEMETTVGGSVVGGYHAFGPLEAPWMPQIYRRVYR